MMIALLALAVSQVPARQTAEIGPLANTQNMIETCRFVLRDAHGAAEIMQMGMCNAFLSGFLDAYFKAREFGNFNLICLPAGGLRIKQVAAVFVQWADRNAALWHIPMRDAAFMALSEAWPCKINRGGESWWLVLK
jgi:hypothetical protein